MKENETISQKPFGIRDKLGYLFGDFGNDFTFILSSSFLLKFYTDVMGVEAAVVGVIMMIPPILVFLISQSNVVEAMSSAGIKE